MGEKKKKILSLVGLAVIVIVLLINRYCFDDILGIGDVFGAEETAGTMQITNPPADIITETPADLPTETPAEITEEDPTEAPKKADGVTYKFRNNKYLSEHYEKHGIDMGFASKEEYEAAASAVINNPEALSKIEKEDGDYVYYVEATNEFVVLSTDGYIRTYFLPDSGKKYFDKQ